MKHKFQISESIRLGAILALSGGFMDAYSYMERGEVFANAQTGNMLLFGVHLSQGDFQNTLKYLFPVLAFALGIALAEVVRAKAGNLLHWRQISVLAEALILIAVSFFPTALNLPANALTSFACGIQVESFRKIQAAPWDREPTPLFPYKRTTFSRYEPFVLRNHRLLYCRRSNRQCSSPAVPDKGNSWLFFLIINFILYDVY